MLIYRLPEPDLQGRPVLTLTPPDLIARLSRLLPPPRIHRQRYHGVLAPFAAEFILPARTLASHVTDESVDVEVIEDLAEQFKVSSLIVRHQLENHKIARVQGV